MRAFSLQAFDKTPSLTVLPAPIPKQGEILVKIAACGLNFADLLMIKGTYQQTPQPPFTLGMEVGGHVIGMGPDTSGFAIGQRVAVFGGQGGLADLGCFPAAQAVAIPDNMSFEDAAALQVAYGTSHVALGYKAKLAAGETLLVLGAAGGVGLTAVEIGKLMGARVIACARGQEKLSAARQAGADHLIDSESEDIRLAIKDLGGADVVYDPVGGSQFTAALRACNPDARMLAIGFASGDVPQIPANHLLVKNITVIGFYWGGYLSHRPSVVTDSLKQLVQWHAQGAIKPHISHVLPLTNAAEGLELLRSRKSTGKIVICP